MISFLKKYLGNIFFPMGWTLLIGVLLCLPGSMLPSETGFEVPQFDKLVHISLFGGFVFLWCLYCAARVRETARLLRWFFLIFLVANSFGISMEFVQKYYIPERDFDLADIIADMIGAGIAYCLANVLLVNPKGANSHP